MKAAKEEPKVDPFDSLPKLDPEHYDDEIIQTFDAMKTMLKEQRDQLQLISDGSADREKANQNEASREIENWFDGRVENLGEDFADVLGKGGHYSLAPGSSQFAKREAIADQVGILMAGYAVSGREEPPRDEIFNTAARSILGDDFQAIRDRNVAAELKLRKGQHLLRPSGAKVVKEQSVEDEAAAQIDAKYFS